jgi:hypothetical protein
LKTDTLSHRFHISEQYFIMAAAKRKSTIILFIWPATLVAAFLLGRLTLSNDPTAGYQEVLEASNNSLNTKSQHTPSLVHSPDTTKVSPMNEGELDPLLQIRSAIAENDPLKQMSLMTAAFSKLTKDNILDGFALLEALPDGQLRRQMENLLLNTWGKLDGPAAMEYVMNKEDSTSNNRGGRGRGGRGDDGSLRDTMAVMSGWAESDPRSAVAWANENGTSERGRNTAMMAALQGWANTDIEGAINYAMTELESTNNDQQGRGGRGGGMESFLISRFAREDPQAATQWAMSQTDPAMRSEAILTTARTLANTDPKQATLWAQSISDPEIQAEALRGTASGWAREDPVAAMNWALSLDDPATSSDLSRTALSTWAREDPYSASDFVIEMEAGATKDNAAATLTQNLIRQDPEMAMLWAESISDPALQTKTLAPITNGWLKKNPEEATKWINSSNLPDQTKQTLLNTGGGESKKQP